MSKKQEAWEWFSIFIRKRDGEYVKCVTCDNVRHWKAMDAGHYITGVHTSTKFDERNCHAQCKICNQHLDSNHDKYKEFMLKTYGKDVVQELHRKSHRIYKPNYEAIIEKYKGKQDG